MAVFCGVSAESADEPWDDYLFEDDGIGPDFYLPAEMATFWIDPGVFWGVAAGEKQVDVGDGDLSIEDSRENVHGRGRLVEQGWQ